jgi:Zn-dependent protease with chaperone function
LTQAFSGPRPTAAAPSARSLETHRDLIARVAHLARERPLRYRITLVLLASLGFGYVLAVVLAALACGLVGVLVLLPVSKKVLLYQLALVPLAFACLPLRALRVRMPQPDGRRVTRREVPALFAEIERVRRAVKAKPVHAVVLTAELNAAVMQAPRLGLLGPPKRYLILGLPLLYSLPPYQFRAVLAHELGHLAGNHARFGNSICRVRQTWCRLREALQANGSGVTRLFTRFFDWYTPYFNAYSFVVARANEFEADRASARVTSADDAGDALVAVYAKSQHVEASYWKSFYARADAEPEPPAQPFVEYLAGLRSISADASQAAMAAALDRHTDLEDTHPSLRDRLAALGVAPREPACFQMSAAHALLGDKRAQLTEEFDLAWRESLVQPWQERHAFMQSMRDKLARYEALERANELTPDEQWDYARVVETVRGGKVALPMLERLLALDSQHAPALYARGRILLEANDDGGAADVERAMLLDEEARELGAQLLYGYFSARRDFGRCDPYRDILRQVERAPGRGSRIR